MSVAGTYCNNIRPVAGLVFSVGFITADLHPAVGVQQNRIIFSRRKHGGIIDAEFCPIIRCQIIKLLFSIFCPCVIQQFNSLSVFSFRRILLRFRKDRSQLRFSACYTAVRTGFGRSQGSIYPLMSQGRTFRFLTHTANSGICASSLQPTVFQSASFCFPAAFTDTGSCAGCFQPAMSQGAALHLPAFFTCARGGTSRFQPGMLMPFSQQEQQGNSSNCRDTCQHTNENAFLLPPLCLGALYGSGAVLNHTSGRCILGRSSPRPSSCLLCTVLPAHSVRLDRLVSLLRHHRRFGIHRTLHAFQAAQSLQELLSAAIPVCRSICARLPEYLPQPFANLRRPRQRHSHLPLLDIFLPCIAGGCKRQTVTVAKLVQHQSQTIDIHTLVIMAGKLLRSGIRRRANTGAGQCRRRIAQHPGYTKIAQLIIAVLADENILRLDISVQDSLAVADNQRTAYILTNLHDFLFRQELILLQQPLYHAAQI